MVKGNWERRVERAAKQKAAKRDAAAAKAKGQLVDPLDILNAVFRKDPDASVWVSAPGDAKLCAAYFRTGECANRRCKWSHAETLAAFGPGGRAEATTEAPVERVDELAFGFCRRGVAFRRFLLGGAFYSTFPVAFDHF